MFKQAWDIIKRNVAAILGLALAYSVLEYAFTKMLTPHFATMSLDSIFGPNFVTILLGMIALEAIKLVFITGFLPMILIALDGGEISVSSFKLFMTRKKLVNIMLLEAIVLPVMLAGTILFIIPGVVWFTFSVMSYFIVVGDDNVGTIEAISKSIDISKGFRWKILGYTALYGVLSILLSMIPVMVVVFDTILISFFYVILALIYRECMAKNV